MARFLSPHCRIIFCFHRHTPNGCFIPITCLTVSLLFTISFHLREYGDIVTQFVSPMEIHIVRMEMAVFSSATTTDSSAQYTIFILFLSVGYYFMSFISFIILSIITLHSRWSNVSSCLLLLCISICCE